MAKSTQPDDAPEKCSRTADLFLACVDCAAPLAAQRSKRCAACRRVRALAVKAASARRIYQARVASAVRAPVSRACIVCGTKFEEEVRRGRPRLTCSAPCRRKATTAYLRAWKAGQVAAGTPDLFEGGGG